MRYEKVENLIILALDMQAARGGVSLRDIQTRFSVKRRSAMRMRDAVLRIFPQADEVIVDWPDRLLAKMGPELRRRDAVCVLTHDAKFDIPAIVGALETSVGYIGVMGSRRTHENRTERLVEAGVTDDELQFLRSPIGLDIGARTPEETAISIVSEIIALRTGRSTRALSNTDGPIHG